ncbi:MAG TPA: hypothetical protein VEL51_22525 [Vicinamibacterales bacterium]|nr:hypothetical protein [Vicinamibacterales bacterium]
MTATMNISEIIARVKASQSALGDGRDARSENERADYWGQYNTHQQVISALMNLPSDIAREEQHLADLEARRADVVAKFAELETAIADFTDWRTVPDARARDAEWQRQWDLRRALQRLEEGTLLKAPGGCHERLGDLDQRIGEVRDHRDRARSALDAHLKAAVALLGAAVAG